ncbi:DUF3429 domain-containing protein [Caulobacter vibrioides]|uniref:DUF3429 domain-containing protein n=1 Tax=Caulobacter vibrioides (strain ATCC 19089 / CIP 103742 / CB 15) TaxID=190650 RepID=Q9A465_CAUVC|nr:DUF3429 domain-containing protein [Caulobacter vibrioides]AAK24940.1 hypothetical protein CC_2978 [Caulobacter vibrioides CB15]ATC29811.1 DUF3429 domain-containing protein [Caulobacter vibrioides]QXZ51327.1 DUF3429 domain-containing protein [Caulobacter vibrioides]
MNEGDASMDGAVHILEPRSDSAARADANAARAMTVLGALGLIPFVAPPLLFLAGVLPGQTAWIAQAAYAGAILAFLGGVRAAQAALGARADIATLVIAMAPPIVGFAVAALVAGAGSPALVSSGLLGLALALAAQGAWDMTAGALPDWYRKLRLPLTVVACGALLVGALLASMP